MVCCSRACLPEKSARVCLMSFVARQAILPCRRDVNIVAVRVALCFLMARSTYCRRRSMNHSLRVSHGPNVLCPSVFL